MNARYFEAKAPLLAAEHLPIVLIDLALKRGIDSNRLLRGTGLFYEDIGVKNTVISCEQFLRLVSNTQRLLNTVDLGFQFGRRLFPSNNGAMTNALINANNMRDAFAITRRYQATISPLFDFSIVSHGENSYINLQDSIGQKEHAIFLLEALTTTIATTSRWLHNQPVPMTFYLPYPKPRHIEQYRENLGTDVHFASQTATLVIATQWLERPFTASSQTARRLACQTLEQQLPHWQSATGLLQALREYFIEQLRKDIKPGISLEQTAIDFHMSPATLKRKLKQHHCSFQQLHDQVRKQIALQLLQINGCTNEQVARYLQYSDVNNFRRSFKRWTGLLPSDFRPVEMG